MKQLNNIVLYFLSCCFIYACTKHVETEPTVIKQDTLAPDFLVPSDLINKIKNENSAGHAGSEFFFSPIKIKLYSDQEDVLSHNEIVIEYSKGGGVLDLKDYVTGEGSFYISFPSEQFDEKTIFDGLYFISDSKKVKIGEEEYGLGCGKWSDLKSEITNFTKKNYFKLNTKDNSYVYATTGQFLVVIKKGVQVFLTHVNIKDSRVKDYQCSQIFKVKKEM